MSHVDAGPRHELIGRAAEIDRLSEVLQRHRLVTVTGPGGVGKTTLALAVLDGSRFRRPARPSSASSPRWSRRKPCASP